MALMSSSIVGHSRLTLASLAATGLLALTPSSDPRLASSPDSQPQIIEIQLETPILDPDQLDEDYGLRGVADDVAFFGEGHGIQELQRFLTPLYESVDLQEGEFIYAWRWVAGQLVRVCYPQNILRVDDPSFFEAVTITFPSPTYLR